MPDPVAITCPEHGYVMLADHDIPGRLYCPDDLCGSEFRFPPLTELEQGAARQHEFVLSRVAAGFSRTEAMQILCCIVSAGIMKGSGDG